jgi:cytidylate kinase
VRGIAVAIDGPAGAGKSTVSRAVAEDLGYVLLDTGALYRSVALAAARRGIDWGDPEAVADVARDLAARRSIRFERAAAGPAHVLLDGEDVSTAIRTQEMSDGASKVSAIGAVREALLDVQRVAAAEGSVVLEGRDIGTVVFPKAEAKFFLTASAECRAKRRHAELVAKGQNVTFEDTLEDVKRRDNQDSNRAHAPLKQADDAVLVDSTNMSIDETVESMIAHVKKVAAS